MIFNRALIEGRNFSIHTTLPAIERKKNKCELLKACGYQATLDFQKDELLVVKPSGDIINVFNDTRKVYFEYKTEEAREKWRKFYNKLFPGEGKRVNTYTKKDGTKTIRAEKRYEPSDFIKNGYLKQKLMENSMMTYNDFMKEMANDVRVLFV